MQERKEVTIGFDLGVASVGWAIVDSNKNTVYHLGSRLFDNPETSVERREKRGARRLLRRRKYRNKKFYNLIKRTKVFDFKTREEIETKFTELAIKYPNIIELKVKGLTSQLNYDEIVWVLHDYLKNRGHFYEVKDISVDPNNIKLEELPSFKLHEFYKKYGYFKGALGEKTINDKFGQFFNFSNKDWTKEVDYFFNVQKDLISEEFIEEFKKLFTFTRDMSKGPGSDNMPSPYSVYGKYGDDGKGGRYVNIWDKNIGKCSIFTSEIRAPKYLPSALVFNLLNELTNIRLYNKENKKLTLLWRLSPEDKFAIVKEVLEYSKLKDDKLTNSKINKIVKKVSLKSIDIELEKNGYDIEAIKLMNQNSEPNVYGLGLSGLDTEKNDFKFQKLETLNEFTKYLHQLEIDFDFHNSEELFKTLKNIDDLYLLLIYQNNARSVNFEIKQFIEKHSEWQVEGLEQKIINLFNEIGNKFENHTSKTHSLSSKAIYFISPKLLNNIEGWNLEALKFKDQELMEEIEKQNSLIIKQDKKYLSDSFLQEAILPPSVKATFKHATIIFNQIIKEFSSKYDITKVVIELARDMTKEKQEEASRNLKSSEKEKRQKVKKYLQEKGVDLSIFYENGTEEISNKYVYKLFLWISQDFKDPYTGEEIRPEHIIRNNVQIDHIIPYSLSYDDSGANKVLVFDSTNQVKGQSLPYNFITLKGDNHPWNWSTFEKYVERVIVKNPESILSPKERKRKAINLLTKSFDQSENSGFLARNLNDTRYATILFRDQLINYSENHKRDNDKNMFEVIAMNGAVTSFLRKNMTKDSGLKVKDRDDYSHHAYDAAIIALFSNYTKTLYHLLNTKLNGTITKRDECNWVIENPITGEIKKLSHEDWQSIKNNKEAKFIARDIENYLAYKDDEVMFYRQTKRKTNRQLFKETIYSIETITNENGEKEYYKKEKINIINEKNIYYHLVKDRHTLIINKSNPEVIDKMIEIIEKYGDGKIPSRHEILNGKSSENKSINYNDFLKKYMNDLYVVFPDKFTKEYIEQMLTNKTFILYDEINDTVRNLKYLRVLNDKPIEDIRKNQIIKKFNAKDGTPKAFYEDFNSLGAIVFKNARNQYKKLAINGQIATFGDPKFNIEDFNSYDQEKINYYKNVYGIDNSFEFYTFIFPGTTLINKDTKELWYVSSIQTIENVFQIKYINMVTPKQKRVNTQSLINNYEQIKINPLGISKKSIVDK